MLIPSLLWADDVEPEFNGSNVEQLITNNSFSGWQVPSNRWTINGGVITGDTDGEELDAPEWIYTDDEYTDFIFTAQVRLTGGSRSNSGIYFRVNVFDFTFRGNTYEAPSGYEFDAGLNSAENASLGDWYARRSLRIRVDGDILDEVFAPEEWNRMTIRAVGNHIEYWLNGTKVIDYIDEDPNRETQGLIGFQMHDGLTMKVEIKDVFVQDLNDDGPNVVTLKKRNATGFVIDGNSSESSGTDVFLGAFDSNDEDQQWEEIDRGGGYYSYQKLGTNFSLDGGAGGARNQNVYLWRTKAGNFNQHWRKVNISGNIYRLEKRNALGFAINGGRGGSDGQDINLWNSSSSSQNLHWIIE
ncbi:MAG: family 16 glycoside hydrolase [Akkermansiaceae bacterium]